MIKITVRLSNTTAKPETRIYNGSHVIQVYTYDLHQSKQAINRAKIEVQKRGLNQKTIPVKGNKYIKEIRV
jgi:hypothetical protein